MVPSCSLSGLIDNPVSAKGAMNRIQRKSSLHVSIPTHDCTMCVACPQLEDSSPHFQDLAVMKLDCHKVILGLEPKWFHPKEDVSGIAVSSKLGSCTLGVECLKQSLLH